MNVSDQESQYTSHECKAFLKARDLEGSMSLQGNCHDNAVVESFFQLLKRERVKRKIYSTCDEARLDIVDYIKLLCNEPRCHRSNEQLSPVEYERRHPKRLESV